MRFEGLPQGLKTIHGRKTQAGMRMEMQEGEQPVSTQGRS